MGKNNKAGSKLSKKSSKQVKSKDDKAPLNPSNADDSKMMPQPSKPADNPNGDAATATQRMPSPRNRKPQMPSPSAVGNQRRGGLGRGLAALIPTGPARPSLGDGAADIVLGNSSATRSTSEANGLTTAAGENNASFPQSKVNTTDTPSTSRSIKKGEHSTSDYVEDFASKKSAQEGVERGTSGIGAKRHSDVSDGPNAAHQNSRGSISGRFDEPNTEDNVSRETSTEDFGASYQEIPLEAIRTNAKQPREVFDEEALQELVHSIKEFGLMQPIVVRRAPDENSTYELIMGERRYRAASRAGFDVIPAIVRETADDEMLRDALLENIHRVQLNPLEEAAAYQQLMEEFGVTQEQLARKIGRSRPLITNMIRLLQLPVSVQRRVGAGVLSAGHARALLGLKLGAEAQENLANRIVTEGMSVRATEEAVTLLNRDDSGELNTKKTIRNPQQLPDEVSDWVDTASDALETKVSVQMGKKKGKIVVEFGGPEDFDRIIELLKFK